ncbi:MAG: hypothetical protein DWQ37_11690 [Planctomycetota bacterium]|nr:MAG: hypothetical protein DWQ37_11690 [Planctomycetota bacterium]
MQLSGCNRSQSKTGAAKVKEKKPLPPFEPLRVFVEPNERSSFNPGPKDSARIVNVLKPGHWSGILLQTQANTKEFTGTLSSAPQNAQRRPLELEQSPYWVSTMRRVTLPKGQQKQFESLFFAPRPRPESTTKASTWIANRLSGSGQGLQAQPEPVLHMPSYQYHMVVLAPQPARYRYLNGLSCVRPRTNAALISPLDRAYYRVEFPPVDAPLALPSHPLCWTSIAYIVWDDVLPDALTPEQQQAMVDWLHWGGALIVSGPDSLDKLAGSFLADYLPAKVGSSGPLQADKLAELHDAWRVRGDGSESLAAREGRTWSGVELVKHTEATAVPNTAELIVERRIGRGRVLVTAFRLAEPELAGWRSFDSMFNACILGRPPRLHAEIGDRFAYRGSREHDAFDARLSSGVRFFSRDVPDANVKSRNEITDALDDASAMRFQGVTDLEFQTQIAESKLIDELKANAGVAGWNDFSPVASAARATLRDAAGISVPKRSFVLKMIGLYLIVVVPVNWLVFRLLGRIEWAWCWAGSNGPGWPCPSSHWCGVWSSCGPRSSTSDSPAPRPRSRCWRCSPAIRADT